MAVSFLFMHFYSLFDFINIVAKIIDKNNAINIEKNIVANAYIGSIFLCKEIEIRNKTTTVEQLDKALIKVALLLEIFSLYCALASILRVRR